MTLRTNSATRRRVVSRSRVVLTTSATSSRKGSTWVGAISWAGLELTAFILAAASGPRCTRREGSTAGVAVHGSPSGILDHANIRQVSIALRIIEAIAHHIGIGDRETYVVRLDGHLAPRWLVEQGCNPQRFWLVRQQQFLDVVE